MDDEGIRFELVLVDDGSVDGSYKEISRLARLHPVVKGFRLSRNFGHQAALVVAMQKCGGELVAIIDDDLQDPPEILPLFFTHLYDGKDVVYGVRKRRKEGQLKRILYAAFYRLLSTLSKVNIPLDAGDFCVMKRCVVDSMLEHMEANPFLRGIRAWVGFEQVGIPYERDERFRGESGYTWRKYFSLAIAGILSFSYVPLRLATILGLVSAFLGFAWAAYVLISRLIVPIPVSGYTSLIVVITFLGGVQLISIGVIGEYLARVNDNTRKWPVAVVAESTIEETK